ncbi:MAG: hypothetical protein ABI234_05935 [Ktedonobacteraceae bacterium]
MQTDILENLDALSPECRQALKAQIKRVQMEAKHLRTQMYDLRKAEHAKKEERKYLLAAERAEKKERKHVMDAAHVEQQGRKHWLGAAHAEQQGRKHVMDAAHVEQQGHKHMLGQLAATGKEWGQDALKRGEYLTSAGATLASAGLQTGLERGGDLWHQLGSQVGHDGATPSKQKVRTSHNLADWKDDLAYMLIRRGQHFLQHLLDRRDDATRNLRKQGKNLGRNLSDRTDDMAWQLHKQRQQFERTRIDQKKHLTRKMRKQGQKINRNMREHNSLWSTLGFVTGLLIAGGAVYWLTKRMFHHVAEEEEQHVELQPQHPLNGVGVGSSGEIRYTSTSQGKTAVATRRSTRAEPTSKFVGVLSTQRYYPLERKPETNERDLVFFRSEEDAKAEGFIEAR